MFSPSAGRDSIDNPSAASPAGRDGPFSRHGQANAAQHLRRGSTAGSIHSISGTADSSGAWGSPVVEASQNAISTLLQPPIVRTGLQPHTSAPASSTHKPPTARDIPPVTLTDIPKIDPADFKQYLSQVGGLYEQLQRVKESEDDAPPTPARRGGKQDEWLDREEGHLRPAPRGANRRKGSTASLSSITSIEAPSPARRSSSGFSRRAAQGPPPLSTIPNVYFDQDFHLENPRTFDIVSERSEVVRPVPGKGQNEKAAANGSAAAPRKALATNAILQEKLSWYMDTIEMHLINSISTASTTFFSALGSLRELHSEAADSVEKIKILRNDLTALDEEIAMAGMDMVRKRRRRENIGQLNEAVRQLRQIVDGVIDCEALVDAGDVEKALNSMDSVERLIAGEAEPPGPEGILVKAHSQLLDLRGASALGGVATDMNTLRQRVGKVYEGNFQKQLLGDMRKHVSEVQPGEVLMRWSSASQRGRGNHARAPSAFPSYMAATEDLRSLVSPSLVGLHRAKHVAGAATAYRDSVLREIRSVIRRPLPSSTDDDNESMVSVSTASGGRRSTTQEKSSILARNLRNLEPEDAEEMLSGMYVRFAETLRRLSTQAKILLDEASSLAGGSGSGMKSPVSRSPMSSPVPERLAGRPGPSDFEIQEELHKNLDVANLLGQAVDLAHEKIIKILKVRSEQTKNLSLPWFLRYYTLNLLFVHECEAISGRMGTALKNLVSGHITEFVQRHGDGQTQKLAQGMESDNWGDRDFTDAHAALLQDILECSTTDAPAWSEGTRIWSPYKGEEPPAETPAREANGDKKEKSRTANIESESFLLPSSAILCLQGITNYLRLIAGIPLLTSEIAGTLISYLQLFNSRCTQLILGAGATKSAGLSHINAKHLALASNALSFVASLIPHLREFVRRHLGSAATAAAGGSGVTGEFDKVRRLLQEHQDSIYQKLVDIMRQRVGAACKEMGRIEWDEARETSSVHAYVEKLSKDTTILHRVLTKHLPEPTVQLIMGPVFASYKEQLGRTLEEAEPRTDAGRDSMLRDIEYIISKIGKIESFRETGDYLLGIVRSKEIPNEESESGSGEEDDKEETKEAEKETVSEEAKTGTAEPEKTGQS